MSAFPPQAHIGLRLTICIANLMTIFKIRKYFQKITQSISELGIFLFSFYFPELTLRHPIDFIAEIPVAVYFASVGF